MRWALKKIRSDWQRWQWNPFNWSYNSQLLPPCFRDDLGKLQTDCETNDGNYWDATLPGLEFQMPKPANSVSEFFPLHLIRSKLGMRCGCLSKPLGIHTSVTELWEGPFVKSSQTSLLKDSQSCVLCSHGVYHSLHEGSRQLQEIWKWQLLPEWLRKELCLAREKGKKKRNDRLRVSFISSY